MPETTMLAPSESGAGPQAKARRTLPMRRRWLAALAVLVLAAGASGAALWLRQPSLPRGVAFEVGSHRASEASVRARAAALRALYGVDMPATASGQRQYWRDVAQSMAFGQVLDDQAARLHIRATSSQTDQALRSYLDSVFGSGDSGRQAYIQALGYAGTSNGQVRDEVRRQLVVSALFDRITSTAAKPTSQQIDAGLERWSCQLGQPPRRQISNIVVSTKERATAIMQQLAGGASFAALARTRSTDTASAASGGDLGVHAEAELESGYGAAAFRATPGKAFGPVKGAHGWNVGLVTKVVPAQPADTATARAQVSERLLTDARLARWKAWLTTVVADSDVRYAAKYRPLDPRALPASLAAPVSQDKSPSCAS